MPKQARPGEQIGAPKTWDKCTTCMKQGVQNWSPRPADLCLPVQGGRESSKVLCGTCLRLHKSNKKKKRSKDQKNAEINSSGGASSPTSILGARRKGERPSSTICSLCGKQYGTTSLVQHERTCVQTWQRMQEGLPPMMRAKNMPELASETLKRVGQDGLTAEEAVQSAWEESQAVLTPCPNHCGRTFMPDRIAKHLPWCIRERGDMVGDLRVRDNFGLGPLPAPKKEASSAPQLVMTGHQKIIAQRCDDDNNTTNPMVPIPPTTHALNSSSTAAHAAAEAEEEREEEIRATAKARVVPGSEATQGLAYCHNDADDGEEGNDHEDHEGTGRREHTMLMGSRDPTEEQLNMLIGILLETGCSSTIRNCLQRCGFTWDPAATHGVTQGLVAAEQEEF